jgi:hypothetical protein
VWSAERFVARSQRSRRLGAHIALVIVVGAAAALAISLIAGARRSTSVVDRFFASGTSYDVRVSSQSEAFAPEARGGVRKLVMWQGLITALAVLTVGLPLGLLAEVTWWHRQTDDLGLRTALPTPIGGLALLVAGIIFSAVGFAQLGARRSRQPLAASLRVE